MGAVRIDTEVIQNLHMLEKEGILNQKKIVLFGKSDYSYRLIKILEQRGYSVFAVIDNNRSTHNRMLGITGVKVWYTGCFFEKYDDSYIFLIMSGYYNEMKKQLEEQGYREHVHIFQMAKIEKSDLWHALNDTRMDIYLSDIKAGKELHMQILEKYGANTKIMIFAGGCIGDVYLMGFYIKEYLKLHRQSLFIFKSPTPKQLADDLGFGNILYMPEEKVWALINYAKVCGLDKVNMEYLHMTSGVHFRIESKMLRYIGYTFMHDYRELFELPVNISPEFQRLPCQENVDGYFKKYGLTKEKTVVLAPNAKSHPLLEKEFWESLAKRLHEKGYIVCTNVASEREETIRGTISVFIKLNDIQAFVEKAGYFIGLRSGLCDILCNCVCKKIILYNFVLNINIDEINFLSLKNMSSTNDLSEYGINRENEAEILERILDEMPAQPQSYEISTQ